MEYSVEHPPPLRKYTLKIFHGGKLTTRPGHSYMSYRHGKVVLIRNLDLEKARLVVFNDIANTRLGYKPGFKFYYRESADGTFLEIKDDNIVSEIVRDELLDDRELNIYLLGGEREETQVERAPTIMFWNCQCLNDVKIRELRALNLIYNPNILFLIESRLSSTFISRICGKLGFQEFRDSPTNRHMDDMNGCVGLAMFWKKDVKLEFHDGSDNHLDFRVILSNSEKYRLIGFYGDPNNKNLSWERLKQISSTSTEDQCVTGGDFNETLEEKEKSGGLKKPQARMKAFENALKACNLKDLPYEGSIFTWKGTWKGKGDINERLDRVVASPAWGDMFPHRKVLHATNRMSSDHIPILLETDIENQRRKILKSKVLSFIKNVKRACDDLAGQDVTTVSRMESWVGKMDDVYYEAVKIVAPHLIQLEEIAVHRMGKVTYERLVTLKILHNIHVLLYNSIISPKPNREYNLAVVPQFSSIGRNDKVPANLSEYLAETWSLIEFIPTDNEEPRNQIVDKIVGKQVENSIAWFKEVSTRDGTPIGANICQKLRENASMIGCAIIMFDNIISLLANQQIKHEGTITELEEELCDADIFREAMPAVDSREICKHLQYLQETFQWHHSKDPLRYKIPDNFEYLYAIYAEIIEHMLEAERDVVMIDNPWIQSVIEEDGDKEKLVKLVNRTTIGHQLDVLKYIGCISYSENGDGIALSNDDKDSKSVILRLQTAASEALKTLAKSKTYMTYEAYIQKLREAYTKSQKNKKARVQKRKRKARV